MTHSLVVYGTARPQGSKRAFINKHTGRAMMLESSGAKHKNWRELVRIMAQDAVLKPRAPLQEPVTVDIHFAFARPKAHYHQRVGGPVLRSDAPQYVSTRSVGDIDKISRSILDALTDAGWLKDDSIVARLVAEKVWTDEAPCVHIVVSPIAAAEAA